MELEILHDKDKILDFLKVNPALYAYMIGDLDDFFWPKTIWYALKQGDEIKSIMLIYVGMETPTLLAFYEKESNYSIRLLERIKSILPLKFNTHLSPDLLEVFGRQNLLEHYGTCHKMALKKTVQAIEDQNIRKLKADDLKVIEAFYEVAYPQNWFDKRMLETNMYMGYFVGRQLVAIAGVHVYSAAYKIATLGNIATHPDFRGQQIGYKLTASLCFELQKQVDWIGLNVKTANEHAIRCYQKIGFEIIADYEECYVGNG